MKGHKRRRSDRGPDAWELIVHLGSDPVTGRQRQKSKLFRGTSRQADTAMAELIAEVAQQRHGPGTDATLNQVLEQWLAIAGTELAPTTVQGYRSTIRTQIEPHLGRRPIDKITTPHLDAFYAELAKTLKPATIRKTHAVIHRAFRQAVRWGLVPTNPASEATVPAQRRPQHVIPRTDQVRALIAGASAIDDPMLAAYLRLAVTIGARRGELCAITWDAIDLRTRKIMLTEAVANVGKTVIVKDTKSHQHRSVRIDPGTATALKAWRDRSTEMALAAGVGRARPAYVFSARIDGSVPVSPDLMTGRFRRLGKVHAPGVRLHDLRHYAISQMLAANVPVKTVSGIAGHSAAAMTLDVYGHHITTDDTGAQILGALLDDPDTDAG